MIKLILLLNIAFSQDSYVSIKDELNQEIEACTRADGTWMCETNPSKDEMLYCIERYGIDGCDADGYLTESCGDDYPCE